MNRRDFLGGTMSTFLGCQCSLSHIAFAAPAVEGCRAAGLADLLTGAWFWKNVAESSGNADWDTKFKGWVGDLFDKFGVRPALVFYDDGARHNALATPVAHFPQGPDGTVAVGVNLLGSYFQIPEICRYKLANEARRKELEGDRQPKKFGQLPSYSETAAWWCNQPPSFFATLQPLLIAAHEFGHILQYKTGMQVSGPWQMEPHADYLAGWYVGNYIKANSAIDSRGALDDATLVAFAETMFSLGDKDFNDRAHHGEPEFRAAMVRAGYDAASLNVKDAFEKGRAIVGLPRR